MNIATALKQEIARVARKEIRAELLTLKKSSSQYRTDIAALKRRVAQLERHLSRRVKRDAKSAPATPAPESAGVARYSAKGFAAQRKRLGLSAADLGALLGVSGASVYLWEKGDTRPRASQMPAIASIRKMSKKEAATRLAAAA
ncbi:MAG: transcriptional regulator, family [Polaromonas sp.]|nr:transcriptional regulator, family [Polaromonas sp.]